MSFDYAENFFGKHRRTLKPVFLHFLNREAYRNLNRDMDDASATRILKALILLSNEDIFSNISYIWENYLDYGESSKFASELVSAGLLKLVSSFPSTDQYIGYSQDIYKYDSKRYRTVFQHPPPQLKHIEPVFVKDQNTTDFILMAFLSVRHNMRSPEWRNFSESDKKTIRQNSVTVNSFIDEMVNENAITLSLFDGGLDNEYVSRVLARYSTYCHFLTYLKILDANIVNGIPTISFYDCMAERHHHLNAAILLRIIRDIGFGEFLAETPNDRFLVEFLETRASGAHSNLVSNIRRLLYAHVYATGSGGQFGWPFADMDTTVRSRNSGIWSSNGENLSRACFVADTAVQNRILHLRSSSSVHREFLEVWEITMKVRPKILMVVSTELEARTLLKHSEKATGENFSRVHSPDHTIYALGELGGADLFMVQSEMGKESAGGITLTTLDTIDYLEPNAVVAVGVAFGLRKRSQKLGDILVSRQIFGYDLRKVTEQSRVQKVISRGEKVEAPARMLDRFRSGSLDFRLCDVHFGLVVSGSTLSNSREFVEHLLEMQPEAIGGEMEGSGLYSVASKRKIDWIVVKGICDWGAGKTDDHQAAAAGNAVEYVLHTISQGGFSNVARL